MDGIKDIFDFLNKYNISGFSWVIDLIIFCIMISLLVSYVIMPIYTYAILPIYSIIFKISSTCDDVVKIGSDIKEINKELKTNGGNSIKDIVIKLKNDFTALLTIEKKIDSKQNAILNFLGTKDISNGLGFYETDRVGNCKFVTHRWCEITGLTETECVDKGWLVAIHEDDRENVCNEFYLAISQSRPFVMNFRIHNRILNKVISVTGYAFPLNDGVNTYGYIGSIKPIEVIL